MCKHKAARQSRAEMATTPRVSHSVGTNRIVRAINETFCIFKGINEISEILAYFLICRYLHWILLYITLACSSLISLSGRVTRLSSGF